MKKFQKYMCIVMTALIIVATVFFLGCSQRRNNASEQAIEINRQVTTMAISNPQLVVESGHSDAASLAVVSSLAFSPNGRILASGSFDHTIKLWNAETGGVLYTLAGHFDAVNSIAFSPDGKTLVSASNDTSIKLWDVATGKELRTFVSKEEITVSNDCFVAVSPNGKMLASWGRFGFAISLWDISSGQKIRTISEKGHSLGPVSFSSDSVILAIGSDKYDSKEYSIKLYEATSGMEMQKLKGHTAPINSVAFNHNSQMLASSSEDKTIILWDIATGKILATPKGHSDYAFSAKFSPDGNTLASVSRDKTIKLWDVASAKEKHTIKGDPSVAFSVTFSPDGKTLAGGCFGGTVKLWNVATGMEIRSLKGQAGVSSVALSLDGRALAAGSHDGTVTLWDLTTGTEIGHLKGHTDYVRSIAFGHSGKKLASISENDTIKLWDTTIGTELFTLKRYDVTSGRKHDTYHPTASSICFIAFISDNNTLVSKDTSGTIETWDIHTGRKLRTLAKLDSSIYAIAVTPSGRVLAAGSPFGHIKLLDAVTGRTLRTLAKHTEFISSIAFSPDGTMLASWGMGKGPTTGNHIRLWDLTTAKELYTYDTSDSSTAYSVSEASFLTFSPNGQTLAVGSQGGTISLLETTTGLKQHVLVGHSDEISSLTFTPDGKTLVSGGEDGTIKLWDLVTGKELASLVLLGDGGWVLVTPDGRFDTNRIDGIKGLHWAMSNALLTSLPIEIFMRDYYEPKLLARVWAREKLKPLRNISVLNRTQPEVKIIEIATDSTETSQVTVEVANIKSGEQQDTAGKPLESGVFDVRLFRNDQLVGYAPENNGEVKLNADGKATLKFSNIKLPRTGVEQVEFSAYAFNLDRVKSATDRKTYTLTPKPAPIKGRAYLIRLGVNAYEREGLNLRYAANDARRVDELAARLATRGEYEEVVSVPLISDYTVTLADGRTVAAQDATLQQVSEGRKRVTENSATKAHLRAVLDVLARRQADAALLKQIPNADKLCAARPEDLVLLSASSHGYTDGDGIFYLIPSDSGTADLKSPEFRSRCVSSDELSRWLRDVDAGELVMIVDACHSAAAVEGTDFKPGPMGSRGLGQLSYDKGMRILTAAQADNVALEKGGLGLLMRALLVDGLTAWQADYKPRDKSILLTEWLTFGVERVPRLYEEMRDGRMRGTFDPRELAEGKTQQPALFDFARRRREVVLARQP